MARRGGRTAAAVVGALIVGQLAAVAWPSSARAAPTFLVDDLGDAPDLAPGNGECATADGTCTLRAALQEADAAPGRQIVGFALPGAGPHTIALTAELPTLVDPSGTEIDGYTQPGATPNSDPVAFDATIGVELRGTGPTGIDGFVINGPDNVIRGLAIYDFQRGIRLFGVDARDNEIVGNLLGTDATGTFVAPEYVAGSMAVNLQAGANNNHIGLLGAANRNVVSGSAQHGIALYDNGTAANSIQNNLIGLAPAGDAPLTNHGHGVDINTWASETVVGGTEPGEGNVIAAVGLSGVEISHGAGTTDNQVIGNSIGTDATGSAAPGWAAIGQFGVNLEGLAVCDDVCAPDMSRSLVSDNVIVNALGGVMLHKATFDNVVTRNSIGVLPDGTPAGHSVFGVRIEKGAYDNVIGPDNVVAHNANGIQLVPVGSNPPSLTPVPTPRNRFTRNSIFANGGLGIDLQPLGSLTTTPDVGVNAGSATPSITGTSSATATVTGCDGCTIELFVADGSAGSYGAGETFLTASTIDAAGTARVRLPETAVGTVITATSTTADGSTSEFARNVAVPEPTPGNAPPAATFTASCPVTECTFDATASIDADGTIEWYEWDFGNGDTLVTPDPSVTYEFGEDGNFEVTLTVVDDDAATASTTITATPVNVEPSASFDVTCDLQLCRFTSTSTDADGELVAYEWDFAGLATSNEADPVFAFPAGGDFTVTHTVTDNSSGVSSNSATVTTAPFPSGLIGLDGFSRTVTTGLGQAPIGGEWSAISGTPPDFAVADGEAVVSIASTAALRSAELAGVSQRDVTVTATSTTDLPAEGWGLTSHVIARHVDTFTEYRARLRRSGSGNVYLAIVRTVGSPSQTVIGAETLVPGVSAAPDTPIRLALDVDGATPTTLRANAWPADQAEPAGWLVTTTDDTPELQAAGSVGVGAAPGSSHATLPVTYAVDDLTVVTGNEPPVPAISATCVNQTCTFSGADSSDSDGAIRFWAWDFGDGDGTSGPSADEVTHTFATFGPQDVTLTVTDDVGGFATATETVVVTNAPPEPAFTAECDELACTFDASTTTDPDGVIAEYVWDFGGGATQSGPDAVTVAHTYLVTDTYTVALTVTDDDGGTDTATLTIEPSLAPTAAIDWSCELTRCTLDASGSNDPDGSIVVTEWALGDGTTATGTVADVEFGGGDPVDVTVTVTDNTGLTATATETVDPNAAPTAVIDALCDLSDCDFDASGSSDPDGSIVAYLWDFGDGTTSTAAATSHTFAEPGEHVVSLTVTDDDGALDTTSITLQLSQTPVVSFTADCDGLSCSFDGSASFDPDGTELTFAWAFGDGTTAGGTTTTHTYATGVPVTVRLAATDEQGSVGRAEIALDPNAPPEPVLDATCDGLSCAFDADDSIDDGTIVTHEWDFGDGATASGPTPTHTYAVKADYEVTVTVTDDEGAAATVTATITPNSAPTAAFTVSCPSTTCAFDAAPSTDADGTIVDHLWDFGDGTTASGPTPTHTFADVSGAEVTLTVVDDDGATDSVTRSVTGNSAPVAAFTVSCVLTTCTVDASASVDPDGTIAEYGWNWNDGTTSVGVTATHTYVDVLPANIQLTVTDDDGGAATAVEAISLSRALGLDTFTRTEQNAWGRAETGGSWSVFGGAGSGAAFSVDGAVGRIEVPSAGTGRSARLLAAFARDTDVTARFSTDAPPTGWGQYVSLIGRRAGVNLEYRARVRIAPDGTFRVAAVKLTGSSTELPIGPEVDVPDLTHVPGDWYRVRARLVGSDPTTIRIRVWPADQPEPGIWHVDVTDSQIELQSGGPVGVNVALSASATNAPVVFGVDDVTADLAGALPAGDLGVDCVDFTCTFDASGVTDPDGVVTSIEWDFGDGGTASGVAATHTYATGGPRTVIATVTDDDGGVTALSVIAAPIDPDPPPEIADDAFERDVTDGFGAADTGGAWQTGGGASAAAYGVADGVAAIVLDAPASGRSARLLDVTADDIDARISFRTDRDPTGWGQYVSLIFRHSDTSTGYRARLRIHPTGIYAGAVKTVGSSSEQLIAPETRADDVGFTPGTWYRLRAQAIGSSPTTLRIKVWPAGAVEPSEWGVEVTDTEALLQRPGAVGLNVALSGSATNAPVRFELDDYIVERS